MGFRKFESGWGFVAPDSGDFVVAAARLLAGLLGAGWQPEQGKKGKKLGKKQGSLHTTLQNIYRIQKIQ